MNRFILLSLFFFNLSTLNSQVPRIEINTKSTNIENEVNLSLFKRFQRYNSKTTDKSDVYESSINSPKSVTFSNDGTKFYVHSLEGYTTTVFATKNLKKIKEIKHEFNETNDSLFKDGEYNVFNYKYFQERKNKNFFKGKPVESCISHNGKYLWVSYYRRDFDPIAQSPSAVAIIDTDKDEIIRVMPTGPLPKMLACSSNNKYISVTHWGDNTVGLIDISFDNPFDFKYIKHLIVDYQKDLNFSEENINRDQSCGFCLRGTVFSPDNDYLLVGKMGGSGGIAIIDLDSFMYLGTIKGMKSNLRHMIIKDDYLFLSTNRTGYVQKTNYKKLLQNVTLKLKSKQKIEYSFWENVYVGSGARTICSSHDGKYIFVAVNNKCKVKVIRSKDMKIISTIDADAYPVGLAVSRDDKYLVVTSQGKKNGGGNSVMIFKVSKPSK